MENTDKANQHYVPKFYLRGFSFQKNKKEIGIYNLNKMFFFQRAKLKSQASKKFFYGKDGQIEDFFSKIETLIAPIIRNIIENEIIPNRYSSYHFEILMFFILMEQRNPMHIENMRNSLLAEHNKIMKVDPTFLSQNDLEVFQKFISNENLQRLVLKESINITRLNMDLDFKILKNNTKSPFITSDFPVIRYNQAMEKEKWNMSSYNGNGWIGQQFLFPLNDKYYLFFFDSNIYKIGNKKERLVEINDLTSINSLNILQFLNCSQNIYFNEKATENYIKELDRLSSKFEKGNKIILREYKTLNSNQEIDENSIVNAITKSHIEIKLEIEKIKIHSKGKFLNLDNRFVQFRKQSEIVYHQIKNNS